MSDWKPLHSQLHERVDWFGHVPTSGCASLVWYEHMVQSRVCVCPCPMLWAPWGEPQPRQFLIYTPNRGFAGRQVWHRVAGYVTRHDLLVGPAVSTDLASGPRTIVLPRLEV